MKSEPLMKVISPVAITPPDLLAMFQVLFRDYN